MRDAFLSTLNPMLVMFFCIIIGYIANKSGLAPENTDNVISKLENCFFVPALIIKTFMNYCTVQSVLKEYKLILNSTFILVIAIVIAFPLSRTLTNDKYEQNIYRYALIFANYSFLGNAVVPAVLGEQMLYPYMLFTLPINTAVYGWGVATLIPKCENKKGFIKKLTNPVFISIIIGVFLGLTGFSKHLPAFAVSAVSSFAACMAPLAMILTGFVIAEFPLCSLFKNKKIYIASFLRLILLPALFILILKLAGADNETLILTLFAFATPLGLNTVVFPAAYGSNTFTGAAMAMVSQIAAIITLPLFYAVLMLLI